MTRNLEAKVFLEVSNGKKQTKATIDCHIVRVKMAVDDLDIEKLIEAPFEKNVTYYYKIITDI
jgi:L-ascorbate metabolism protein UlaG (beta-lactamase superfamily)